MTDEIKAPPSRIPFIATGVIILMMLVILCLYQLRQTQVAIVTTFGEPEVVTEPGLHLRAPWPIQQVTRLDKRMQTLELTAKEINTQDRINVISRFFVFWSVGDAKTFFNRFGTLMQAELQLRPLIESQQESVLRQYTLAELLSSAVDIEQALQDAVKEQVAGYGIEIAMVGLAEVSLSEANTAAVFERMRQEQQSLAAVILAEGASQAKILRDNAASEKAQALARTEAEAKKIRGDAVIAAAEQYPAFEQDLEFALFLRKLDALVELMSTKTTLVLDPRTPPFDLLEVEATPAKP